MNNAKYDMKTETFSYSQLLQDIKFLNYTRNTIFEEKEYFRQLCNWLEIKEDEKIADLGCGTGNITKKLQSTYPKTKFTGIDKDPYFIQYAKSSYDKIPSLSFINGDLSKEIPFASEYFNTCFSFAAFHQISDYNQTLKECYRVLKDKGKIVLFIPIDECPQSKSLDDYYPNQKKINLLEEQLLSNYNKHVQNFISSSTGLDWREAPKILEESGFKNILIRGMFTPYCPENNNINDYLELLFELWKTKLDFVFQNFSNKKESTEFEILRKEYDNKYLWFKHEFKNKTKIYSWGGAPLLIIKGIKKTACNNA